MIDQADHIQPKDQVPINQQPNKPLLLAALAALLAAIAVFVVAKNSKPASLQKPATVSIPLVQTLTLDEYTQSLPVRSQGVVRPMWQTQLLAEVSGRVVKLSPSFEAGAFVEEGDWLLSIEDTDYVANLKAAEAELARAQAALEQAQEETRQAQKDWALLGRAGQANDLALKKPQLAQARASVKSARVGFTQARKALERTKIVAPYAGLIASRPVQLEQFVSQGVELGQIYSTQAADIRLPVTFREYQLMDAETVPVQLSSEAVPGVRWQGQVHRLEHRIEERSRLVYLIVRIDDPYQLEVSANPPLPFGLFVEAKVLIPAVEPLLAVPRTALTPEDRLWVVTENQTLEQRVPEVLYKDRKFAYLRSGLKIGEPIYLAGINTPLPGMKVRLPGSRNTSAVLDSSVGLSHQTINSSQQARSIHSKDSP